MAISPATIRYCDVIPAEQWIVVVTGCVLGWWSCDHCEMRGVSLAGHVVS